MDNNSYVSFTLKDCFLLPLLLGRFFTLTTRFSALNWVGPSLRQLTILDLVCLV